MNSDIQLKKLGLVTFVLNASALYAVLENDRERLSPWFWWAGMTITPNFHKAALFMILYIIDTKRKKAAHLLSEEKLYDEQFLVFYNGAFSGMIGLDHINTYQKNAEIWGFIAKENEGKGVMSSALQILHAYAAVEKELTSLYAKIAAGNKRGENPLKINGYNPVNVEYNVPTSTRNPTITDVTIWKKILARRHQTLPLSIFP